MLGTRGCRLGLQFPEIYEMQVRAIVRAARAVRERTGEAPLVEIMHPLVGFTRGARPAPRAHRARRGRGADGRVPLRDDDRAPARGAPRGRDRRGGGLLLLRDERPHADDARLLARRRGGQVPHVLPRARDPRAQPVRGDRRGRRRRPHADRRRARARREAGRSSSGSAASTAESRARSRSATGSGSTTSRARRTACRSRGSPRRRRRSPRRASPPSPSAAERSAHLRDGDADAQRRRPRPSRASRAPASA